MMRSGGTPNLASTPEGSSVSFDIVFIHRMRSLTSCVRSLSPVEMSVSQPWTRSAWRARVPITSSASTPATISSGQPCARTSACSGSICCARSSGIGGRFALYSGYHASRNVLPGASNTTAR